MPFWNPIGRGRHFSCRRCDLLKTLDILDDDITSDSILEN